VRACAHGGASDVVFSRAELIEGCRQHASPDWNGEENTSTSQCEVGSLAAFPAALQRLMNRLQAEKATPSSRTRDPNNNQELT
jgi:hypothetical protein